MRPRTARIACTFAFAWFAAGYVNYRGPSWCLLAMAGWALLATIAASEEK